MFGSLFGHSVTQNLPVLSVQQLNAPNSFERVFTLDQGPAAATFVTSPTGRFPLPNGVFTRALPEKQRPPAVDAYNVTVQRQLTDVMSIEVGYVGNYGAHQFVGDGPDVGVNEPTLEGFPNVPRDMRKPFFAGLYPTNVGGYGGAFGWTQGISIFCNCGHNWYNSVQARFNRRFKDGYSYQMNYTWQKAEQEDGWYFFYDRNLNKGSDRLGPDPHLQPRAGLRAPVRHRQEVGLRLVSRHQRLPRRLAVQRHPDVPERRAVRRQLRRRGGRP